MLRSENTTIADLPQIPKLTDLSRLNRDLTKEASHLKVHPDLTSYLHVHKDVYFRAMAFPPIYLYRALYILKPFLLTFL